MDIKDLLEKAKELLIRDKKLMPVLFIETEKETHIIGLISDFNKIDKREMMANIGRDYAKKKQKIISVSLVCEANVSKIKIDDESLEKCEAIVVAKLNAVTNKKELITQEFEISNGDVIFKGGPKELDSQRLFLLDAFMQGYEKLNFEFNFKLN